MHDAFPSIMREGKDGNLTSGFTSSHLLSCAQSFYLLPSRLNSLTAV
jgi:hypothetical protein